MASQKHVIVVGAGIIGASIAWHLTKAGARVTVVSQSEAGGVATPNTFAWINASWGNPEPYFRLRIRSMAEWKRLAKAVEGIPLSLSGGLCFDLPRQELEAYAAEHSSWGYGMRRVGRAEAGRIEPNLAEPPDLALHIAEEGAVEPVAAVRALLGDAERHGARIVTKTAVASLTQTNGKVVGVETRDGPLAADEVVLAAGVATPTIAASAGISMAVDAPPGLIVHSRAHARLLNGLVIADRLHMRQTADGRIIAGSDFSGTEPGTNPAETAKELFGGMKAMLRGTGALELDFHTIGYRPTPADGFPLIGRPDGIAGLYVAVMHSGITLAPVVGLFAAEELLEGRRDPLLAPYGVSRSA